MRARIAVDDDDDDDDLLTKEKSCCRDDKTGTQETLFAPVDLHLKHMHTLSPYLHEMLLPS